MLCDIIYLNVPYLIKKHVQGEPTPLGLRLLKSKKLKVIDPEKEF